ncbi:MAG: hypothetical protein LBI54_01765 [Lachnospiraceae bacterium]|nr:hypothetical protein [Lachnospiraceae bacterium]
MKKTKKRLLSTLLIMAMVFTLLPFNPAVLTAVAAESVQTVENTPDDLDDADILTDGEVSDVGEGLAPPVCIAAQSTRAGLKPAPTMYIAPFRTFTFSPIDVELINGK